MMAVMSSRALEGVLAGKAIQTSLTRDAFANQRLEYSVRQLLL